MATCALYADPLCKRHVTGEGHPERPARFDAVFNALEDAGLVREMPKLAARVASDDELALCHTREYIATARRDVQAGLPELSTGDTTVSADSFTIATHAVGGALNAVDALLEGTAERAFCLMRPPGHHATSDRGMGFCLFNAAALAARHAQRRHGLERVLILDWDVHHGNGTQDIFYADPSVLFCSTHQWPWYPGTGREDERGEGRGAGTTLNLPFPAGSGRDQILTALRHRLQPAMESFRPDLVVVSAGFDSRAGDPLGRFLLEDEDFAELTRMAAEIAGQYAQGRLLSVLEGGYSLSGLASAATAHVQVLAQES